MTKTTVILFLCAILIGCSAARERKLNKSIVNRINSGYFENQFTGCIVYDPATKDTLFQYNSKKYFLPASNTKIFTLYTALQLLPEQIPSLKYISKNDTLYVQGMGDPSSLHPILKDSSVIHFLAKSKNIALHLANFDEDDLGPGWSWEDFDQYYAPSRSPLPLYGNITSISKLDTLRVSPSLFRDSIVLSASDKKRKLHQNIFYFDPSRKDTLEVPFIINTQVTKTFLERALNREVGLIAEMPIGPKDILYGIPSDSLYKRMMHESDNFIAEQLLILASSFLSDTLNGKIARDYILANQLSSLKHPPRWVDGSGLSRYNLFTPESMAVVLQKMYEDLPKERLFRLFPAGGENGTLSDWFRGNPKPYIYAKSGSMGNTYCLSGYLLTKSGKTLIFSFMNNHHKQPSASLKKEMTMIFERMRDTY